MLVQVNAGNGVKVQEDVATRIEAKVKDVLSHHSHRISRVEVHLSDENGQKHGGDDKRCMMEARVEGLNPIAVSHQAPTLVLAIDGAVEKLERAVGHELGRRQTH